MKQSEADRLAQNLIKKFGLPIGARIDSTTETQRVILIPEGIHPNESFQVNMHIGWRSLFFELVLGKFAADLVHSMGNSSPEKKEVFASIAQRILAEKATLSLTVNHSTQNCFQLETWPVEWKSMALYLRKAPLEINTENHGLTELLINLWAERFFGCIIALSPLEEIDEPEEVVGLPEGASIKVLVNRYERNRYNRTICINFHGSICKVCGLNMKDVYGPLGDGFIHIHHIVPVSRLGEDYKLNPINDLVPVCPNCHAMLHRRDYPYTVQELKVIMKNFKMGNTKLPTGDF